MVRQQNNVGVPGRTVGTLITIFHKVWPFASRLSRSLKVIGTDTDRSATYDFLLVFHSNYGPISYRFQDKGQYLQDSPTLVCI